MKAILVIDVPMLYDGRHLCNECPIWNNEHCFCQYDFNTKAKGCPLKPMPNKKPVSYHDDLFGEVEKNFNNIGWNVCIDAILGETE